MNGGRIVKAGKRSKWGLVTTPGLSDRQRGGKFEKSGSLLLRGCKSSPDLSKFDR